MQAHPLHHPHPHGPHPHPHPGLSAMRFLSSVAALAALGHLVAPAAHAVPVANVTRRAPSSSKSVIIQMFEWTWDSVAAECTNFIGPAGYGFVQGEQTIRFALD